MQRIESFKDEFRFLSNFWQVPVVFEGMIFRSSEHAYVAAKTLDLEKRKQIQTIEKSGEVKRLGRKLALREDWEEVKLSVMESILRDKFDIDRKDTDVWKLLDETGDAELIEGNTWGDVFWGQCPIGTGRNELGKILMIIREDNRKKLKERT